MLFLPLLATTIADLGTLDPPSDAYNPNPADASGASAAATFELILSNVIGVFTIVGSLYFILVFVTAGINWLSAGGDSGKIQKARDSMINGVLGLLITVASYAVIGLIGSIVGIELLHPGALLLQLAP